MHSQRQGTKQVLIVTNSVTNSVSVITAGTHVNYQAIVGSWRSVARGAAATHLAGRRHPTYASNS